ncbi:hypothetical protein [Streptomyces lydicus]|uniref:hypothetical protein n=1 Tax=Streptomyces lydicus TaxID=47763 RepID=UPI001011BAB4|nr:hypothetical protein [Streptomyces lydicus]MCZ1012129.1 hypothetical protein [Streptomyces lydicus]
MTTPTPTQAEPTTPAPELRTGLTADEMQELLERRARLEELQKGLVWARALDDQDTPPAVGPRDLSGLDLVMAAANANQAYYFSQPAWNALIQINRHVTDVLRDVNVRAERAPQEAIKAARITTLAASLIARHAAEISSYLDTWNQQNIPGLDEAAQAMRTLVQAAETHAAQAAGLDDGQTLDTPRLLKAHVRKLNKELRRAAPPPEPAAAVGLDDADDPALDSALSIGAAIDPELAEASQLMNSLIELGGQARRAGHRMVLDVRLHGMVEAAQLRGFEMISGIAQSVIRRYDTQDQATSGRRNIAAMIFHYAEQRLERMRGTLGADEQREEGYYESDPPDHYMSALREESGTVLSELRAKHLRPEDRLELQIRFLLAQRGMAPAAAEGNQEWGTQARFPPLDIVAGMQTETPVETREALIKALRRRVENNPFQRDAHFFNAVADRFAQELAGPPELSAQALETDVTAAQVRAVAEHLVERRTEAMSASPLVLSEAVELNVTYPQAERALAVLHSLNVVGPSDGLKPRETLTRSHPELSTQLVLLEERLPNLLALQKSAAELAASPAPEAPAQAEAAAAAEPTRSEQGRTPADAAPAPPAEPALPNTPPALPRRDRTADRPHPGNFRAHRDPAAESTPADQDVPQLLADHQNRFKEVLQTFIDSRKDRAAAHPAPPETTPTMATSVDEAQHNAQQPQQSMASAVR